jgi:hypothetical protein
VKKRVLGVRQRHCRQTQQRPSGHWLRHRFTVPMSTRTYWYWSFPCIHRSRPRPARRSDASPTHAHARSHARPVVRTFCVNKHGCQSIQHTPRPQTLPFILSPKGYLTDNSPYLIDLVVTLVVLLDSSAPGGVEACCHVLAHLARLPSEPAVGPIFFKFCSLSRHLSSTFTPNMACLPLVVSREHFRFTDA